MSSCRVSLWAGVTATVLVATVQPSRSEDRPLRIVTFGTSLTARGAWQDALARAIQPCVARPVEVEILARSGASSAWALTAVADVVALRPDIVLIEFSANDAALDRWILPSTSEANLRTIIARLRHGSTVPRIVLMAMNPVIGLRGVLRPFLNYYYDIYARVAAQEGLTFIDHRPGWRALSVSELAAALPDGSHPRSEIATRIIVPAIKEALFPHCGA